MVLPECYPEYPSNYIATPWQHT